MKIEFESIGVIYSPFNEIQNMPIQPAGAFDVRGTVEVFEKFKEGLRDLDGFSHIILLYQFNKSEGYSLEVIPFMDCEKRGVFSTRAPRRPNQIGLSVVKLLSIENSTLHIEGVDILDGTPLIDIKPYVPEFNSKGDIRIGWLEKSKKKVIHKKSDNRFR